jgi:hypothetical protein
MLTVQKSEWAGTRADLETALAAHRAALDAHRLTVDEPAPYAPPLVARIIETGGSFVLAAEIAPEAPPPVDERAAIVEQLAALDREVPRVLEDVIAATGVTLPPAAAVKVARKAELRAQLKALG